MEWIIGLAILVGIGILVGVLVSRHRYIKELEAYGWTFVNKPSIEIAYGLNNPPFGYGTNRTVDDQIVGKASSGASFQAFKYRSSNSRDGGYVVAMRLPKSLPEFYVFPPDRQRPLVQGVQLSAAPWFVVAEEENYGRAVMNAVMGPVHAMAAANMPVDLGVDHDQLVALNVPRKAAELREFVEALSNVHRALCSLDLSTFAGSPPPPHLSFYKRPHWVYLPSDISFLDRVSATRGGKNHQALDIVYSDNFGLPFISLTHRWQTEETRIDHEGKSHTETKNHQEAILEFRTPFPFSPIGVNRGSGQRVRFESEAFNKAFRVRCEVPRFASDVIHPRQMEYFLRTNPLPFEIIRDGRVLVSTGQNDPGNIDLMSSFLHGFFGRVPDFAWKELGAWPRPIAEVEKY